MFHSTLTFSSGASIYTKSSSTNAHRACPGYATLWLGFLCINQSSQKHNRFLNILVCSSRGLRFECIGSEPYLVWFWVNFLISLPWLTDYLYFWSSCLVPEFVWCMFTNFKKFCFEDLLTRTLKEKGRQGHDVSLGKKLKCNEFSCHHSHSWAK